MDFPTAVTSAQNALDYSTFLPEVRRAIREVNQYISQPLTYANIREFNALAAPLVDLSDRCREYGMPQLTREVWRGYNRLTNKITQFQEQQVRKGIRGLDLLVYAA